MLKGLFDHLLLLIFIHNQLHYALKFKLKLLKLLKIINYYQIYAIQLNH